MDRKIIALGIILVVIVSGVLAILVIPAPALTHYHYERNLSSSDPHTTLVRIQDVIDCEISISFVADSELLYSVDIEFDEPMRHWDDFTWLDAHEPPANLDEFNFIGFNTGALVNGRILIPELSDVPVKSINLTLGMTCCYTIQVSGKNMTTSIRYDNGARFNGSEFQYQDFDNEGGDVHVVIDSDVNITDSNFKMNIWGTDELTAIIRNPSTLGGSIDILTELVILAMSGWTFGGYSGNWRFSRSSNEEMDIDFSSEIVYISILTQ